MAAELEDLRAGESALLVEYAAKGYRDQFGVQRTRARLLPYAMIRARGTTTETYEYMVPRELLDGDMFDQANFDGNVVAASTVGGDIGNRMSGFLDLESAPYLATEPPNDSLGAVRVHFMGGV